MTDAHQGIKPCLNTGVYWFVHAARLVQALVVQYLTVIVRMASHAVRLQQTQAERERLGESANASSALSLKRKSGAPRPHMAKPRAISASLCLESHLVTSSTTRSSCRRLR